MKKLLIRFSFLLLTFVLFYSCKTNGPVDAPNNIGYDSILVSKIYHLDNDSTKPSCSLKINYVHPVEYADTKILKKIQGELNYVMMEDESYEQMSPKDAVDKYVKDYIENYKRDAEEQFPNWEESGDTEDYFSYYKTLSTKVLYDMSGLLSYQISSMDYKGGANSSTAYRNVVIDLKTGNLLGEQDVFIADFKNILNPMLVRKIMEQNHVSKIEGLLELGYWVDDLTSNNNFYVDDKGITYIFNPLEYSTPSIGAIKIFLTYDEVNSILKPDSPISHLSGK